MTKIKGRKITIVCYPAENYGEKMNECEYEVWNGGKSKKGWFGNNIMMVDIQTKDVNFHLNNSANFRMTLKNAKCEKRNSILICRGY